VVAGFAAFGPEYRDFAALEQAAAQIAARAFGPLG